MRQKLPNPIGSYRVKVLEECIKTAASIVETCIENERHPALQSLLVDCSETLFKTRGDELKHYHGKLLEWETSTCSSNHYSMDTVRQICVSVSSDDDDDDDTKPPIPAASHCNMRQENEQRRSAQLLDMKIEIFAYWKLTKKRLVDCIILPTRAELVDKCIHKTLKQTMLEAVFSKDDAQLAQLLSPEQGVVQPEAL